MRHTARIAITFISVAAVGAGAVYAIMGIHQEKTPLDIIKVERSDRLNTASRQVQFLVDLPDKNGSRYTALSSWIVDAGIDTAKIAIQRAEDGTIRAQLPPAQIFQTTKGYETITIRDGTISQNSEKGVRLFSEAFVKTKVEDDGLLEAASDAAVEYMRDFYKTAGVNNPTIIPDNTQIIKTPRTELSGPSLSFAAPSDIANGFDLCEDKITNCWKNIAGSQMEFSSFKRMEIIAESDDPVLFNPGRPDDTLRIFAAGDQHFIIARQDSHGMFVISARGKESSSFINAIPLAMFAALNFTASDMSDCSSSLGVTGERWASLTLADKRNLWNREVSAYAQVSPGIGIRHISEYGDSPIIIDRDGASFYASSAVDFSKSINSIIEDGSKATGLQKDDVVAIIYNRNIMHRDRIIAITDKGLHIFVPKRFTQEAISDEVLMNEVNSDNRDNSLTNISGGRSYKVNIESDALTTFFSWLFKDRSPVRVTLCSAAP